MLIIKKEKLNLAIVDYHVRDMQFTYEKKNKVKLNTKDLMKHCYRKYKEKFLEPDVTEEVMLSELNKREKAGVIVVTNDMKILFVYGCNRLCLPKGKKEYFDENLMDTAFRELEEETSMYIK